MNHERSEPLCCAAESWETRRGPARGFCSFLEPAGRGCRTVCHPGCLCVGSLVGAPCLGRLLVPPNLTTQALPHPVLPRPGTKGHRSARLGRTHHLAAPTPPHQRAADGAAGQCVTAPSGGEACRTVRQLAAGGVWGVDGTLRGQEETQKGCVWCRCHKATRRRRGAGPGRAAQGHEAAARGWAGPGGGEHYSSWREGVLRPPGPVPSGPVHSCRAAPNMPYSTVHA